jgi:hypothetical protein
VPRDQLPLRVCRIRPNPQNAHVANIIPLPASVSDRKTGFGSRGRPSAPSPSASKIASPSRKREGTLLTTNRPAETDAVYLRACAFAHRRAGRIPPACVHACGPACAGTYAHVRVRVWLCLCVSACVRACVRVRVGACVLACMLACVRACVPMCERSFFSKCLRARARAARAARAVCAHDNRSAHAASSSICVQGSQSSSRLQSHDQRGSTSDSTCASRTYSWRPNFVRATLGSRNATKEDTMGYSRG